MKTGIVYSQEGSSNENIQLIKATRKDAELIHRMQIDAFKLLLEKYKDYETSPGNESLDKIISRISENKSDFYIIVFNNEPVGAVRVVDSGNKTRRISPIFITPDYQGKGIATETMKIIEEFYGDTLTWELSTILQEKGLCKLYENLGHKRTGKTQIINDKITIVFYKKSMT